jgi:uncharacterized protein YjaG (DUF416 family)
MTILHYDETANIQRLKNLPIRLRVLFALLTALRILPTYARFHARTGRGDPAALQELVERLWRDVSGEPMTEREAQAAVDRAMQLVPPEDDGWDEESQPYAEDAAAAIAYALRARLTDDPQEAAWAARRVYEAADHFAETISGLALGEPQGEKAILSQRVVQAELARQARDLGELAELARSATDDTRLSQMRQRSEHEAESFFQGTG